ncbi:MAG: hypothetical protein WCP03_03515 [Candidatus Saccharibacteria bacterium]
MSDTIKKLEQVDQSRTQINEQPEAYALAYAGKEHRDHAAKARQVASRLVDEIVNVSQMASPGVSGGRDIYFENGYKYPVADIVEEEYGEDTVPFVYHPVLDIRKKVEIKDRKRVIKKHLTVSPVEDRKLHEHGTRKVIKNALRYATNQDSVADMVEGHEHEEIEKENSQGPYTITYS